MPKIEKRYCSCGRGIRTSRDKCGKCIRNAKIEKRWPVERFMVRCPFCTSFKKWNTMSCCKCNGTRQVEYKPELLTSVWGVPGCNCDTCRALKH